MRLQLTFPRFSLMPVELRILLLLCIWIDFAYANPVEASHQVKAQSYQEIIDQAKLMSTRVQMCITRLIERKEVIENERNHRQIALGEFRIKSNQLSAEIVRQSALVQALDNDLQIEQKNLKQLQSDHNRLLDQQNAQAAELKACKSHWFTPNWACDAAANVAELVGLFRNLIGEIEISERRIGKAQQDISEARRRLEEVKIESNQTSEELEAINFQLLQSENDMVRIHATLSKLNEDFHASESAIDELRSAIEKYNEISGRNDEKSRLERILIHRADNIRSLMARFNRANVVAPDRQLKTSYLCAIP